MALLTHFGFLGVHISRVKSVNLDSWAPEQVNYNSLLKNLHSKILFVQVVCLQQMGNSRARAVYEALLSDNFRRPQTDSGLESFIRSKYEQKKYIAREWIPPPFPPKVDWDKEIDEELETQKRKKKAISTGTMIQEPPRSKHISSTANSIPIAPLPKPAHSPKSSRLSSSSISDAKKNVTIASSSNSTDLLGLDTALTNTTVTSNVVTMQAKNNSDTFDFFADAVVPPPSVSLPTIAPSANGNNSLKKEEDDFFNQKSIGVDNGAEKGKLTKDNILALYGKSSSPFQAATPQVQPFNANFQQQPQPSAQDSLNFFGVQGGPSTQQHLFNNKPPQQQPIATPMPAMFNNGNNGNFIGNVGFGTSMQSQQINRLNEENIRKIESLNFNNFK